MRPFHPTYIPQALIQIVPYLWVTIAMVLGTLLFGGILGLLLAAAKIRRGRLAKALAYVYTYLMRCIPSVVMLFLIYYGLPMVLAPLGIQLDGMGKGFFVITTFSILFSANMSEVFRSAYESIDPGQREAALTTGLTEWQAFYRIILPQSVVVALPNVANAMVNLMKEGSLAYTIGLIDIMGKGQLIIGIHHGSYVLETYLALTVLYWLLTFVIEKGFGVLEHRLSRGRRALTGA